MSLSIEDELAKLTIVSKEDDKPNNIEDLKIIIKNNDYVKNCISNKKKDKTSLSYLIDIELSQSDSIKLGIGLENIIKDIIKSKALHLIDIRPKNTKNKKERDLLYKDDKAKIIYYAELKCNLNLDTEKSKSTSIKCEEIEKELKNEYPDYEIKMFLLSGRYIDNKTMPSNITKKYNKIKSNLIGINEYFNILNIKILFNEKEYKEFLNILAKEMFIN
jgi:hypothetical protein